MGYQERIPESTSTKAQHATNQPPPPRDNIKGLMLPLLTVTRVVWYKRSGSSSPCHRQPSSMVPKAINGIPTMLDTFPARSNPLPSHTTPSPGPSTAKAPNTPTTKSTGTRRTVVLHAAPTKYKQGQMHRWLEEDNKGTGAQLLRIRWLTQEHRRAGKLASSLVIYVKEKIDLGQRLRMGRKLFRTAGCDCDR